MLQKTKAGTLLGTIGLVGGIWYSFKRGQNMQKVVITGLILGAGGFLVGNALTKIYE